ncbi:hypothetical protein [Halosegnis rubeus]|jgi:hypothetical protein|uniref:hypothetical protein n=1 Tax=Halosegnis rubeus TaxID=2212850 RepID=UPI001869CEBD|nr:hypothetical protein [Halosegnis rubeus]
MNSDKSEQRDPQSRVEAAIECYLAAHDTERSVEIGDELHLLCEDCDPEVA